MSSESHERIIDESCATHLYRAPLSRREKPATVVGELAKVFGLHGAGLSSVIGRKIPHVFLIVSLRINTNRAGSITDVKVEA